MATLPLGALIRRRRVQLGLTQQELAARIGRGILGVDVAVMEDDHEAHPRLDWVERIALALDLPPETLLREAGLAPLWPVGVLPDAGILAASVAATDSSDDPADGLTTRFDRLYTAIASARETRAQTATLRTRLLQLPGYAPRSPMTSGGGAVLDDSNPSTARDVATTSARFNWLSDASS